MAKDREMLVTMVRPDDGEHVRMGLKQAELCMDAGWTHAPSKAAPKADAKAAAPKPAE